MQALSEGKIKIDSGNIIDINDNIIDGYNLTVEINDILKVI
jgi:hypothetical protein